MRDFPIRTKEIDIGAEFGSVPFGRQRGAKLSAHAEAGTILIMDFSKTEDVTASFLTGAVRALQDKARPYAVREPMWVATGFEEDTDLYSSLLTNIGVGGLDLAIKHRDAVTLSPFGLSDLDKIYGHAQDLTLQEGAFTQVELAETAEVSKHTIRGRISILRILGAISRIHVPIATPGARYFYRAITSSDLLATESGISPPEGQESQLGYVAKKDFVAFLMAVGKNQHDARLMATRIYNGLARQDDDWFCYIDEDMHLNLDRVEQEILAEESPTRISYITGAESRQRLKDFIRVRRDTLRNTES